MNKPGILVATLLAGNLFLAACTGSRTPSGANTASADNAVTTNDARAVGNSGGSIQASQLEAERVGTGTASGSMVTVNATPAVTVPLGGSNTGATTGTDQLGQTSAPAQSSGMTTASTPAVTSPMTDPTGKTTGQPSPQTQNSTAQTTPMGDENWSANRNNPVRQTDKMDNNGVNADNNTGVGRTTPATMTPAPPDNSRMRAAQRRSADPIGAQQPTNTTSPTTTAPPMSVQDRERMGRDAANPAGMEQRVGMTDYGTPEERTMPPMVSSQATAIDRITTRLDEIDAALETKMSSRRKAALRNERKKLMYRLGTLKAVELPATPNQVPTGPGGAQRP